jgi:branched-chain amino acid transport system permease protein
MAIRAVSQDEETARIMGINFNMVVYVTFAIGSGWPPLPAWLFMGFTTMN